MKKYIYLFVALGSVLFAKDVTDGLLSKESANTIIIDQLVYPSDKTCERKYTERFIYASEKLIKRIKNQEEDLDFCRPLNKLFALNKRASKIALMNDGRKKDFEIKDLSIKYKKLVKKYNDSYYINLYALLFAKKFSTSRKNINQEVFEQDQTDYSNYAKVLFLGKDKAKKEEYIKYRKVDRLKVRYKNVKSMVQSRFNLIYLNASKDVFDYLKKYEEDKVREFLEYEMKEHKKRGLELNRIYLEYSILLLEENKRDYDESEKWVLKSYKEGPLYEQTVQLMRIRAIRTYFDVLENYPKYIGDREEYDYIKKRLDNIKIQEVYLKKTSQEMFYIKAYLNEKLGQIFYREKKRRRFYFEEAVENYGKAIKYGTYEDEEEKEKIRDNMDELYKEIKKARSHKKGRDLDEE